MLVESRETVEESSDYNAGREGRWVDFPDEYDPSQFRGEQAQNMAREANAFIRKRQEDYRRGLLDFLRNYGVEGHEADQIASAPGVDGFRLGLSGGLLPEVSNVDPSRFIGDKAQKDAKALNWSVGQRQKGFQLGKKVRDR